MCLFQSIVPIFSGGEEFVALVALVETLSSSMLLLARPALCSVQRRPKETNVKAQNIYIFLTENQPHTTELDTGTIDSNSRGYC